MSRVALLDVNVLVALLDSNHVHYRAVWNWFDEGAVTGWASCPITQNGLVRVLSQPSYPGGITVGAATEMLASACAEPQHEFWSCDISMLNESNVDRRRLHGHRQVTDVYLLALAVQRDGCFVTLDRAVPRSAVPGPRPHHLEVL